MKDYGYAHNYLNGTEIEDSFPSKSIIIHRYYDVASKNIGAGDRPSVINTAEALGELFEKIQKLVCGDDQQGLDNFKVYLVAHSMGGLICRCLLQNNKVSTQKVKGLVDKVFTYGTPHNEIDVAGANVPGFLGIWNMNNFNCKEMAAYLNLEKNSEHVNMLNGLFDTSLRMNSGERNLEKMYSRMKGRLYSSIIGKRI